MMMVLPLLIIVLLPKVVNTNDPEMRKVRTCCYSEVLCKRYCIDINDHLHKNLLFGIR